MEICNYSVFNSKLIELMEKEGVTPECSVFKLWQMLDNNYGTDLIGRTDKIVEEAKELSFEAYMVNRWTAIVNGKEKADKHALRFIWEFSDLFGLVMQMANILAKATDTPTNDFCQMMIGASLYKFEKRKADPNFLHDQDEE